MLLGGQPALFEPAENQRYGTRRKLRLEAVGFTAADKSTKVLIHDLSQTGILIQTEAQLSAGETIQVELPHGDSRVASVVWASDDLFGCKFEQPISRAAISAALLKAPADGSGREAADESPVSASPLAAEPRDQTDSDKLSPLARTLVIVSLALLTWMPIVVAVALLVS